MILWNTYGVLERTFENMLLFFMSRIHFNNSSVLKITSKTCHLRILNGDSLGYLWCLLKNLGDHATFGMFGINLNIYGALRGGGI